MTPNIYDLYKKWESGEVRKEDIKPPFPEPENIVEISIIDEDNLLDAAQLQLLQKAASLPFKLGEYASLAEMLNKLGVNVIIEKGIITREIPHYLDAAILYWQIERARLQGELRKCEKQNNRDEELEQKLCECLQKMEVAMHERNVWGSMRLRGLYDPKDNVIKLFPEEMASEPSGMDELLVSTLAHEAMHAYFNRPGHEQFPYVLFVEEPMAEFGMLVYLAETRIPYFDWAHEDVSSKKTCYRYGAMLYDKYTNEDPLLREDLEDYKVAIDQYDMLIVPWGSKDIFMPTPTMKRDSATVNINGKCGKNLEWSYDANTCQLTIFGSGIMDNFIIEEDTTGEGWEYDDRPWSWLGSATIKKVVIEDGVFNISNHAFYKFTSINELVVKRVAIDIGIDAFAGCENLDMVVFEKPNEENAFAQLKTGAFKNCKKLKHIILPKDVNIENDVFYGCDSLDTWFLDRIYL